MSRYSMLFVIVVISAIGFARQGNCGDVFVNTGAIDCLGQHNGNDQCPPVANQICPNPPLRCPFGGIGCYDNINNYILAQVTNFNVPNVVPKWTFGQFPTGRVSKSAGLSYICSDKYLCFCDDDGSSKSCETSQTHTEFVLLNLQRNEMLPCGEN